MLDLPPGRYRVTALSERSPPVSVETTSTPGATTAPELILDESGSALTQHKNKFGKDYPAAACSKPAAPPKKHEDFILDPLLR